MDSRARIAPQCGMSSSLTGRTPKIRQARLDEGLDVLTGLWSGEPFRYDGTQYQVKDVRFAPPIQQPRIPIWVAGGWPNKAPLRRAARWDGIVPASTDVNNPVVTPQQIRDIVAYIMEQRRHGAAFDVVVSGQTQGGNTPEDAAIVTPYVEAGATWWLEFRLPWAATLAEVRERIRTGPPRV